LLEEDRHPTQPSAAGFRGEILEITDRRSVGGRRVCQKAAFGKEKRRSRRNDPDGIKKLK